MKALKFQDSHNFEVGCNSRWSSFKAYWAIFDSERIVILFCIRNLGRSMLLFFGSRNKKCVSLYYQLQQGCTKHLGTGTGFEPTRRATARRRCNQLHHRAIALVPGKSFGYRSLYSSCRNVHRNTSFSLLHNYIWPWTNLDRDCWEALAFRPLANRLILTGIDCLCCNRPRSEAILRKKKTQLNSKLNSGSQKATMTSWMTWTESRLLKRIQRFELALLLCM